MANVLQYGDYLSVGSNARVSTEHYFCGKCDGELPRPYGFFTTSAKESPLYEIDYLKRPNGYDPQRQLTYFAFCPWCGEKFDDKWSENREILNQRSPDHFTDPGTHGGDHHEFPLAADGTHNWAAGHWLSTTDGSICWCSPDVSPSKDGCTIRHKNVPWPAPEPDPYLADDQYDED